MQIREQGRKVQCIRSEYDATIGRSRQKVVATFARYTTSMPAEGLEKLTDAELKTLEAWLSAKQEQHQSANRRYAARSADTWLNEFAAALANGDATMTAEHAAAIWKGLSAAAKALRKAGHPKPKAERKAPAAAPAPEKAGAAKPDKEATAAPAGKAAPKGGSRAKPVTAPKKELPNPIEADRGDSEK